MCQLRSIWGVGLCLALAGCATTEQRVLIGPGGGPVPPALGLAPAPPAPPPPVLAANSACGCQAVPPPMPPPVIVQPGSVVPIAAPRDSLLTWMTSGAARFFPGLTVRNAPTSAALRDGGMQRTSNEEEPTPLPLVMTIAVPRAGAAGGPSPEPVAAVNADPSVGSVAPSPPPTGGSTSPHQGEVVSLEYEDDPAPAGRPRLASDGRRVTPPLPLVVPAPAREGPEATYPASFSSAPVPSPALAPAPAPAPAPTPTDSSALTSIPKTREVWPTRQPWRPRLLPRVVGWFQKAGGRNEPAERAASPSAVPGSN
jgi:hypothetical protein